jgi:hypothetical protein
LLNIHGRHGRHVWSVLLSLSVGEEGLLGLM